MKNVYLKAFVSLTLAAFCMTGCSEADSNEKSSNDNKVSSFVNDKDLSASVTEETSLETVIAADTSSLIEEKEPESSITTDNTNKKSLYKVEIICLENSTKYPFQFDKSVLEYDRGGDFHLVGSSATECYLNIVIQDWEEESYDVIKSTNSGSITKEFVLSSGREAFCYNTDIDNTYHMAIDADGIVESGNGIIKISVGNADKWPLSVEEITEMVDAGF